MTNKEAQDFLNRIKYNRPGWDNMQFVFEPNSPSGQLVLTKGRTQSTTGPANSVIFSVPISPICLSGDMIPPHPTKESLLFTVLLAVLWMEEHEVFEYLMVDDELAYEPHRPDGEAYSLYMLSSSLVHRALSGYGPVLKADIHGLQSRKADDRN